MLCTDRDVPGNSAEQRPQRVRLCFRGVAGNRDGGMSLYLMS
jgi:hypothetical protein